MPSAPRRDAQKSGANHAENARGVAGASRGLTSARDAPYCEEVTRQSRTGAGSDIVKEAWRRRRAPLVLSRPVVATQPLTIVLLGAPGSGKGTQAARLCERYGLAAVSTGEILRQAVIRGTPLGQRVKQTLDAGGLVDDETMVDLVRERLSQPDAANGVVLDGFPRRLSQAEALDQMLGARPRLAVVLDVPAGLLERRLQSRLICLKCRTIYAGGTAYGSEEELCSRCNVPLIRRDDDNIETIRRRLATYQETVDPLLEYYRSRSAVVTVDGTQAPDAVFSAIVRGIEAATGDAG